jgi:hypothetical protein
MQAIADAASLLSHDPQWVVFWAGHVRPGQFAIWAPYLRRTRYRTLVVRNGRMAIDPRVVAEVATMPRCAVADPFAEVITWLERAPDLRGFLYVGSYRQNAEIIDAFPDATHVWIGHGESAKKANRHRTATVYDSVFVADYEAVRRYRRGPRAWIAAGACAIGVPVVEGLEADPRPGPRQIRSILYAPTWEGGSEASDYGSLPIAGPALLTALPELRARGVEVMVRPHPSSGHRLTDRSRMVEQLLEAGAQGEPDKAAAMTRADVLIGDVSGLTSEFLFTRKPILMPVWPALDALLDPVTRAAEYPYADPWHAEREPLAERLADLERHDRLAGARERAARRAFRGHRTVEEAVAPFDLALEAARGRGGRLSVRRTFEIRRRLPATMQRWTEG